MPAAVVGLPRLVIAAAAVGLPQVWPSTCGAAAKVGVGPREFTPIEPRLREREILVSTLQVPPAAVSAAGVLAFTMDAIRADRGVEDLPALELSGLLPERLLSRGGWIPPSPQMLDEEAIGMRAQRRVTYYLSFGSQRS